MRHQTISRSSTGTAQPYRASPRPAPGLASDRDPGMGREPLAARTAGQRLERASRLGHSVDRFAVSAPEAPRENQHDERTPGPPPISLTASPDSIQRRVGFEIEMMVAADIDGQDAPEKVIHYENGGLQLTIDHGGKPIKNMTKAIKAKAEQEHGHSPTGEYHSILEIVTPPGDVDTPKERQKTMQYVKRAEKLALTIFGGTDALRERVPLGHIVDTGSPLFVSADVARYKVAQAQSLDAHIQASVGIDVAQIPSFFRGIQTLKKSRLVTGGIEEDLAIDYAQGLATATRVGREITDEIRQVLKRFGLGKILKPAQDLANLQGLLTTIALYLDMGKQFLLGTGATWKNFTSLLARVDLAELFQTSLTPGEREIMGDPDNREHVKEQLLDKTGRIEQDFLLTLTDRIYGYPVVTCGDFVDNIFTTNSDGFMPLLRATENFKTLRPESVGPPRLQEDLPEQANGQRPQDGRRKGAIFETRVMKARNDLGLKVDEVGNNGRYPLTGWYAACQEIVDQAARLNQIAFGVEEESDDEIQHRQEYEEYMRQRRDAGPDF